jgi:hypothetical protein
MGHPFSLQGSAHFPEIHRSKSMQGVIRLASTPLTWAVIVQLRLNLRFLPIVLFLRWDSGEIDVNRPPATF